MNPFGLPDHQLAAFARPLLEYLPAEYHAEDAARAEIDAIESLSALASPEVVATRITRIGLNVSTKDMTERLLEASDERTVLRASGTETSIRPSRSWRSKQPTESTTLRLLMH